MSVKTITKLLAVLIITPLLLAQSGCPSATTGSMGTKSAKEIVKDDMIEEIKNEIKALGGTPLTEDEAKYVHRGIAKRSFMRSFTLSDDIVVKGCGLVNGMLTVELEKIIPEEKRARLIPIGSKKIKSIN